MTPENPEKSGKFWPKNGGVPNKPPPPSSENETFRGNPSRGGGLFGTRVMSMFHFWKGSWGALSGVPPTKKCAPSRDPNMSADKNTAPETTFPPPDGLKRRFLGLAHPPPLLLRQLRRNKCEKYGISGNTRKTIEIWVFMGFQFFE